VTFSTYTPCQEPRLGNQAVTSYKLPLQDHHEERRCEHPFDEPLNSLQ